MLYCIVCYLIVFGILIVITTFILLKFTKLITEPLLQLTKNVKKIGDGNFEDTINNLHDVYKADYSKSVNIKSNDEIGELARSFTKMIKTINDNFGHSTGDKTLQVIAMALKNSLRDSEFVARYGGEEFVLLLPDITQDHISTLLNRVREKVKNIPFKFKNQRITVTLSIGAAQVMDNETIEVIDKLMYR